LAARYGTNVPYLGAKSAPLQLGVEIRNEKMEVHAVGKVGQFVVFIYGHSLGWVILCWPLLLYLKALNF
jgi:hypothetical protein